MTTLILKALIDETNCIGCTKCITTCPTDAIVGAKNKLHTVIPHYCTSCSRCIDVCPTNCIHLATKGMQISTKEEIRLTQLKQQRLSGKPPSLLPTTIFTQIEQMKKAIPTPQERKKQVADAIARVKAHKKIT